MTRRKLLDLASSDLNRIHPRIDKAMQRLDDQRRGQPHSTFGGEGGPGANSSPVEAALGLVGDHGHGITPDKAAARIAEIDRSIARIVRDLRMISVIIDAEVPAAPTDKQRREAERAKTEQVDECQIIREHADRFEVALCESTLGGLLPYPKHVCRWVHDFARKTDRLPTAAECITHANGERVMVRS